MGRVRGVGGIAVCVWLAALGCKKEQAPDDPSGLRLELVCPGAPGCSGDGDGQLYVGVSKQLINPTLIETEWDDANGNNDYDPGESFTDVNGNGVFDAIWIAGFGSSRPATGINDELTVRALALQWNDVTAVIAYLDVVGYLADDAIAIRARPEVAALDVDHILIAATHNHEGADVVGVWGRDQFTSGINPEYQELTHERTAAAIVEAVGDLRPAAMRIAVTETVENDGTTDEYVLDARDPRILDPTLTLAQFVEAGDPSTTIATLISWAAHAEYGGPDNNLLSADYPHWLREAVETAVGGTAVFVQGPIGGQIGPFGTAPLDQTGTPVPDPGLPRAEAVGRQVGALAVDALTDAQDVVDPEMSLRTGTMYVRFDNELLQAALLIDLWDRELFLYDETQQIDADNVPWAKSRTTYIQVGPLAMISAPGELFPETWIGGFDGSYSFGQEIVSVNNNPPDLSKAPAPPYLQELMLENEHVQYPIVAGFAEDYLGYIVPAFNYVLDPDDPYFEKAPGHHYEETVSYGPDCEAQIVGPMRELVTWTP